MIEMRFFMARLRIAVTDQTDETAAKIWRH